MIYAMWDNEVVTVLAIPKVTGDKRKRWSHVFAVMAETRTSSAAA
jgi:hypothetical protein